MTQFNSMQAVKRKFFALRNGIIADTIRKAGANYKIIFGLNMPQLIEIAESIGHNPQLADDLWNNKSTRESMLLAPMLMDPVTLSRETASLWATQAPTTEVSDILCHRLLRHTPYALELAKELASHPDPAVRYTAIRLLFNLLPTSKNIARDICQKEIDRQSNQTKAIATRLLDELDFFE